MDQLMTQTDKLLTGDDLLAMGDIGSCELIDGRIMSMSPTGGEHGYLEFRMGFELERFVRQQQIGWVLVGEVGLYTRRSPDRVRGADVAFISRDRAPDGPTQGFLEIAPEVVVEIMSPSDRWQDVQQKIEEYFSVDVHQVWVVEPDNRRVLIYSSPTSLHKFESGDVIKGEGILEGFTLDVTELFAR
jgi:Uma2 family endonuclease